MECSTVKIDVRRSFSVQNGPLIQDLVIDVGHLGQTALMIGSFVYSNERRVDGEGYSSTIYTTTSTLMNPARLSSAGRRQSNIDRKVHLRRLAGETRTI